MNHAGIISRHVYRQPVVWLNMYFARAAHLCEGANMFHIALRVSHYNERRGSVLLTFNQLCHKVLTSWN